MNLKHQCIPCTVRRAVEVAEKVTDDKSKQQIIITRVLEDISKIDFNLTGSHIGRLIEMHAREISGIQDPYKELKDYHNNVAEDICKVFKLQEAIDKSDRPIETACKLAIAGNIIDMGVYSNVNRDDIENSVNTCLSVDLDQRMLDDLEQAMSSAKTILYLADNAGEIVFDKLLVKMLDKSKVKYVVKGSAVANDATMSDAIDTGMCDLVEVIDNGSDCQGTALELCSKEFRDIFDNADMIISKGQANYETLSDIKHKDIFYLLKAKCNVIADDIGCPQGTTVLLRNSCEYAV